MKPLDPLDVPLPALQLIEANAGTGKTYTITTLYLRLLLERRLEVGQILVVTYTNAATAELRRKVRERIAARAGGAARCASIDGRRRPARAGRGGARRGDGRAAIAGASRRRCTASTRRRSSPSTASASACCTSTRSRAASPFDVELIGDERLLLDEVVRDFWTPRAVRRAAGTSSRGCATSKRHAGGLAHLAAHGGRASATCASCRPVGGSRGALTTAASWTRAALGAQLQSIWRCSPDELRRRKDAGQHAGRSTTCCSGSTTRCAATGGAAAGRRDPPPLPAALIDEFQDTDPVQYRIFRRASTARRQRPLFLIGDPKQAIYGFRGADVFAYMRRQARARRRRVHARRQLPLRPALVRAVNALFDRAPTPFVFPEIPVLADATPPRASAMRSAARAPGGAPLRMLFVRARARRRRREARRSSRQASEHWLSAAVAAEIARAARRARRSLGGRPLSRRRHRRAVPHQRPDRRRCRPRCARSACRACCTATQRVRDAGGAAGSSACCAPWPSPATRGAARGAGHAAARADRRDDLCALQRRRARSGTSGSSASSAGTSSGGRSGFTAALRAPARRAARRRRASCRPPAASAA